MEKKLEIKWFERLTEDRVDSVWYGGEIAEVTYGRFKCSIEAVGDVAIVINDEYYKDKNNTGYVGRVLIDDLGIKSDEELRELEDEGKLEWLNNNWFEVVIYDTVAKKYIELYDEAIIDLDVDDDFSWLPEMLDEIEEDLNRKEGK